MRFKQWIPNLLCSARILLGGVALFLISRNQYLSALFVFIGAIATDYLDGKSARYLNACTTMGKWLDPIADKILCLMMLTGLLIKQSCPPWFLGLWMTIAISQCCGLVLLKNLRPHLTTHFLPSPLSGWSHFVERAWIVTLLFNMGYFHTSLSPISTLLGYCLLSYLGFMVFAQQVQKFAAHLVPFTVNSRKRFPR